MRTMLSLVGGDYTPESFALEAREQRRVLRVAQNAGVAASCAKALTQGGLACFLAYDFGKGVPCRACFGGWLCHHCGGFGGPREKACAFCTGGQIEGGTGGRAIYDDGRVAPLVVHLFKRRLGKAKNADIVRCESCHGTGKQNRREVFGLVVIDTVEVVTELGNRPSWCADSTLLRHGSFVTGVDEATVQHEARWKFGRRRVGTHWLAAEAGNADFLAMTRACQAAGFTTVDVGSSIALQPRHGPLWVIGEPRPVYKGPSFRGVRDWRIDAGRLEKSEGSGAGDRAPSAG